MKQSISMPIALLTILSCSDGELFVLPIEESAEATVPAADPLTGNLVDLVGDLGFSQFSEMEISESEELQNQGVAPGDIRISVEKVDSLPNTRDKHIRA